MLGQQGQKMKDRYNDCKVIIRGNIGEIFVDM